GVGLGALRPDHAPYVASKFAVVGLSEVMSSALASSGIGVSVLCPGLVEAHMQENTARLRGAAAVDALTPPESAPQVKKAPSAARYESLVLKPLDVGRIVLRAISENRLHIFTHQMGAEEVNERHGHLMTGFPQAA